VRAGDVRIGIGVPAIGNLHSHAFQRAMAGLTEIGGHEGDSFWSWRDLMYRFVGAIGPDAMEAIAARAYMDMLEAGFCRVGEFHYLHHDPEGGAYADPGEMAARLAAAAAGTGIGLTLLPVFYAHGGFGGQRAGAAQRRFLHSPDSFARLTAASRAALAGLPDAVVGIAPHSLRAVKPDELAEILPLAEDGPVHIHIAEQMREVEDCLAWSGARPVRWLLDHAPVDRRWCLVHATHVDAGELADMARSGAVAGLCPITEANLGDGIFPARAFVDAGTFGVGSIPTSASIWARNCGCWNMASASSRGRATCWASRVFRLDGACGSARSQAVPRRWACPAALRSARRPISSCCATMAILLARSGDAMLDTFVFAGGRRDIADVWRAGDRVVIDGRHRDHAVIEARYRRVVKGLLEA
jgi:formiminoglutamate deiminase